MKTIFNSNGKLLLSGEYVVLDGALALAIPTSFGQSLEVVPSKQKGIHWRSLDPQDTIWFEGFLKVEGGKPSPETPADGTMKLLCTILQQAKKMNSGFLTEMAGLEVTTRLQFQRDWGLGSSSTLINNIAQWAQVDAFELLQRSLGGSGYDIAAAQHPAPVLYSLVNGTPSVKEVTLSWDFTDRLFFVHLNKKQDSREGIARYKISEKKKQQTAIKAVSGISKAMVSSRSLTHFMELVEEHEHLISEVISLPTIKERLFGSYPGAIKSLGAWGGDFILATGGKASQEYFRKKGYTTVIPFAKMIK